MKTKKTTDPKDFVNHPYKMRESTQKRLRVLSAKLDCTYADLFEKLLDLAETTYGVDTSLSNGRILKSSR